MWKQTINHRGDDWLRAALSPFLPLPSVLPPFLPVQQLTRGISRRPTLNLRCRGVADTTRCSTRETGSANWTHSMKKQPLSPKEKTSRKPKTVSSFWLLNMCPQETFPFTSSSAYVLKKKKERERGGVLTMMDYLWQENRWTQYNPLAPLKNRAESHSLTLFIIFLLALIEIRRKQHQYFMTTDNKVWFIMIYFIRLGCVLALLSKTIKNTCSFSATTSASACTWTRRSRKI